MNATTPAALTGIKIAANGAVSKVQVTERNDSILASLYEHTASDMVERFQVISGDKHTAVEAWMDEEGRINGSEPNLYASMVIGVLSGNVTADRAALGWIYFGNRPAEVHFGDILLLGDDPDAGETISLPAPVVDILLSGEEVLPRAAAHAEQLAAAHA